MEGGLDEHGGFEYLNEQPVDAADNQKEIIGKLRIQTGATSLRGALTRLSQGAMSRTPDEKMPHESKSSPPEIQNYLDSVSDPLLDRIDLHMEVPQVKFREISGERTGETSAQIRDRVAVPGDPWRDRGADFSIIAACECSREENRTIVSTDMLMK